MINNAVNIDLHSKWLKIIRYQLKDFGFSVSKINDNELPIKYFALCNRLVSPSRRTVYISNELYKSKYYEQYKKVINRIRIKLEHGEDITPYLSKKILKINYNDDLLNDWGIHHLHLGESIEEDGFCKRTGPLLYVRFENNKAYFINIYMHGAWTKKEMYEIIHKNWKNDFELYRLKGAIKGVYPKLNDNQHAEMRKNNLNALIEIKKHVVYKGFGMGINAAGGSVESVCMSQRCLKALSLAEEKLKTILILSNEFRGKGCFIPVFIDNILYVIELYTYTVVYKSYF